MFNHLNVNSRQVVFSICDGKAAKIGKKNIVAFEEQSKRLLAVLSINLNQLRTLTGQDLVNKVITLNSGFKFEDILDQISEFGSKQEVKRAKGYRLGKVKMCSFRGLAPADKEWEYNFEGKSHLICGPNGCGKSSLLGAICWCLTGTLFRDDCPPREPEKITAYPFGGGSGAKIERDDVQALIDENGNSSSATKPYWVELQFIYSQTASGAKEVYLKRSNADGLSLSKDGNTWLALKNISEAGIDELDAELRVLMPAKVTHMQFGKNADLIRLLADVAGYGDLESIAELAESVVSNSKRIITIIKRDELEPESQWIQESINKIQESADDKIKELPSYKNLCKDGRTKEDIATFGKVVNEKIDAAKAQLAEDLGLEVPDKKDKPKHQEWQKQSDELPGQVSNLLSELEKPLDEIFDKSFGLKIPKASEVKEIEIKLNKFEDLAKTKIEEFIQWAKRKASKKKLSLMLMAASFFPKKSDLCPVCEQSLDKVPKVKAELEELHEFSLKEHLKKEINDFERSLEADLEAIISPEQREIGLKNYSQHIVEDWESFKKIHCKELLLSVAERFDSHIESEVNGIRQDAITPFKISPEHETGFVKVFSPFIQKLDNAKRFVTLCRCINANKDTVSKKLQLLLIHSEEDSEVTAFKEILERAKSNNEILKNLLAIQSQARELYKSTIKIEGIKDRISILTSIANSAKPIKELKDTIRSEVKDMVSGDLGKRTEEYYNSLYDKEVLEFAQLTTGHAANPDVKDVINLYLKAGNHQVPMGPFSNAGRMRALLLSFAFALLEKSYGSLEFIVLDDPVLSLDDEHKARFVDNLVKPIIQREQVILGTHYERFFQDSEPIFLDEVKLRMIPRQRAADFAGFEPGDLLERVRVALQNNSGRWREVAGNIRFWVERTLSTLSGYCPQPFIVFNDIPQSLDRYSSITDPVIATAERDTIIRIFRGEKVNRILHPTHHNEPIQKPEVVDAMHALEECTKGVRNEIKRFKESYNHALLDRRRGLDVVLEISEFKEDKINRTLSLVRKAAAGHNAEGIEWDINEDYAIENCPVVQVCSDVISPIALPGQYLLLDWEDREPANGDLVVVETSDKEKYVRRIWREENGTVILEGANPTVSYDPVHITSGTCTIRRIVGILYDQSPITTPNDEWSLRGVNDSWFDSIVGVRVKGTSLEPVARNGQIILIRKQDVKGKITDDMLVCVSIRDIGEVIKRCFIKESQCVLCAINPNEREIPIVADLDSIQHAYVLKGVIFEVGTGRTIE